MQLANGPSGLSSLHSSSQLMPALAECTNASRNAALLDAQQLASRASLVACQSSSTNPLAPERDDLSEMALHSAVRCEQAGIIGGDVVHVWPTARGVVVFVADGAGGTGRGEEAARQAAATVEAAMASGQLATADRCVEVLYEADDAILAQGRAAEATAVVVVLQGKHLWGASVGDSGAWLVGDAGFSELTENQVRKPLLGSGNAAPVPFEAAFAGTLLVATDGLLKYASPSSIASVVRLPGLEHAASALLNSVRLRSGALQDDVALALVRA